MSVPFGARRETLSQQLTRIEASRPAHRDTSGVVVMDLTLKEMLAEQSVPAFHGLTPTCLLAEQPPTLLSVHWSPVARIAGEQEHGDEISHLLRQAAPGNGSGDIAELDAPEGFNGTVAAATARAAEERQRALDGHDVPNLVDPLSRAERFLFGIAAAAILAALIWFGAFISGPA